MSDNFSYKFHATVLTDESLESFLARAEASGVEFDSQDYLGEYCDNPTFGPGTKYAGRNFSALEGVALSGGALSLGISTVDLYHVADRQDGVGRTRLDVLLDFLSAHTTGEVGLVQGCLGSEHDDEVGRGDAIVRCADGKLRLMETPQTRDDWHYSGELLAVSDVLPESLVSGPFKGNTLRFELEAYKAAQAELETSGLRL